MGHRAEVGRKGGNPDHRLAAWVTRHHWAPYPATRLRRSGTQPAPELIQTRCRETGIVPIEAFVAPELLAGRSGSNRHPLQPRVEAAGTTITRSCPGSRPNPGAPTRSAPTVREAERLLLWAIIERGKALSDLSVEDCAAYRDWLSMLGRVSVEQWPFRLAPDECSGSASA